MAVDVGIGFSVEYGTTHLSQTVASCRDAGTFGNQSDDLGFSSPVYVDTITCDDRGLGVRVTGDAVEAVEVTSGKVLGRVPIPPGSRVVKRWPVAEEGPADGGFADASQ
jgi:hypothetical protein